MIRELDEGDNPHNEANWYKPNPCLRYPSQYSEILLKQIRDEYNAAYTSNDPDKIRKFLTGACASGRQAASTATWTRGVWPWPGRPWCRRRPSRS